MKNVRKDRDINTVTTERRRTYLEPNYHIFRAFKKDSCMSFGMICKTKI